MPTSTKARHEEIYAAAVSALEAAGGVVAVDQLQDIERQAALERLYSQVATSADCSREIARRNVAKAMRKARFTVMKTRDRAGTPPNTSLVLSDEELAFIKERYGGEKSRAIHDGLKLLMEQG